MGKLVTAILDSEWNVVESWTIFYCDLLCWLVMLSANLSSAGKHLY